MADDINAYSGVQGQLAKVAAGFKKAKSSFTAPSTKSMFTIVDESATYNSNLGIKASAPKGK